MRTSVLHRWRSRIRAIGPGALAAAAFIGPGTVTTATVAGARFGYALAWALLFATLAAIVLHEMAARLGVVSRRGLGEAVLSAFSASRPLRYAVAGLLAAALLVGNAAYEGGNIAGAALGVGAMLGDTVPRGAVVVGVAAIAAALLLLGGYRVIERALLAMVALMSLCFLATALIVRPDAGALLAGFSPSLPSGAAPLALGLIGTTIVPYNLFLHAATARRKWANQASLPSTRFDVVFSIGSGGFVSLLVLVTAAAGLFGSGVVVASAVDMARQLEPAFGAAATALLAAGLFAAGLTSAMTAPLASAFAAGEIFGFSAAPESRPFRWVALTVLAIGTAAALSNRQPVELILFAQFANGLLLPFVAACLLYLVNRRDLLGEHRNGWLSNLLGGCAIVLTAGLGIRALAGVLAAFR